MNKNTVYILYGSLGGLVMSLLPFFGMIICDKFFLGRSDSCIAIFLIPALFSNFIFNLILNIILIFSGQVWQWGDILGFMGVVIAPFIYVLFGGLVGYVIYSVVYNKNIKIISRKTIFLSSTIIFLIILGILPLLYSLLAEYMLFSKLSFPSYTSFIFFISTALIIPTLIGLLIGVIINKLKHDREN